LRGKHNTKVGAKSLYGGKMGNRRSFGGNRKKLKKKGNGPCHQKKTEPLRGAGTTLPWKRGGGGKVGQRGKKDNEHFDK